MQEKQIQSLAQQDPLEKEMATHFIILAWEIPQQRRLSGCSSWGCKESDTNEHACTIFISSFKFYNKTEKILRE